MATTIFEQPSGQGALSRSPILFKVRETSATVGWRAFIDVYVGTTATPSGTPIRLTADYDMANVATFDVSDIVRGQIPHAWSLGSNPAVGVVDGLAGRYVTVAAGYIDDNGDAFPDQATSGAVLCYDGYLTYGQSAYAVMGAKATSLRDGQKIRIPRSANSWYLPIQQSTTPLVQFDGVSKSLGAASNSSEANGRYIQLLDTLPTNSISTLLINSGGSVINVEVEFVDVCKYDIYELMFINKQGFFETLWMYGQSAEGVSQVASETYTSTEPLTGAPSRKSYNINARGNYRLNSSFIHESNNHLFEELTASEGIVLVSRNNEYLGLPLTLKSKSVEFQKGYDAKLINYELSFEEAFDKVRNYWV